MGNSYSDINPFSSKNQVPKHLQPTKKRKHIKKPVTKDENLHVKSVANNPPKKVVGFHFPAAADLNDVAAPRSSPKASINDDVDDELAEEETILVGSGPRGAFRWFKGRRYINYAQKGGLENNLLPNDQLELDRLRVLSFIIKWAFKGNIIAPVESDLKTGIKALNVGFGPGMWPGHHIIDMALDHPNSQFTAVDIMDLLPSDFEEEAKSLQAYDTNGKLSSWGNTNKSGTNYINAAATVNDMTLFTPMHPNLSSKLQNTTTPVVDSSTLDTNSSNYSHILLTKINEESTFDSTNTSCTATSTNRQTSSQYSNQSSISGEVKEDVAAKIGHLFINGVSAPDVTPPPVVKRQLLKNLEFYQANVMDAGLPFEDNQFDFVKQHLVTASFTLTSWKKVMKELIRVTKPGGYIQLLEIDYNTFNLGPKGKKWEADLLEATRLKRQMEPRMARQLPDLLKAVGLIDVSSKLVSIPLGSWGLDLGVLWKHNMEMFADSTAPLLSRLVGISASEYRKQWHNLLEEVKDRKAFSNIHAAWGRKSPTANNETDTIDWSLCPLLSDIRL